MKRLAVTALFVLLAAGVMADSLNVIQLRYRDADDIIAAVRPLLGPDERITGLRGQVVISARPERQDELAALVAQLDRRAQQLTITVEQQAGNSQHDSRIGIGGGVSIGGVMIGGGSGGGSSGIGIGIGGRHGGIGVGGERRDTDNRSTTSQTLSLLDGGDGYITLSQSRPRHWRVIYPGGASARPSAYFDAVTGFWVRPRLDGQEVTLELATRREDFAAGGWIEGQSASTRVRGRLGEWIAVGGIDRDESGEDTLLLGQVSSSESSRSAIRVRVSR